MHLCPVKNGHPTKVAELHQLDNKSLMLGRSNSLILVNRVLLMVQYRYFLFGERGNIHYSKESL